MGMEGTTYPSGYEVASPEAIMRNILEERVLGLPGEPRADKEVAWSEVPRG
jgi:hypothetical protein